MIEDYGNLLENKIDFGKPISKEMAEEQESEEEDIDFVGTKSLKEEIKSLDRKIGELDSLNLFGASIDKTAEDLVKDLSGRKKQDQQRMRGILADLVSMAKQIDPSGDAKDFSKRKAFNYYDPYSVDAELIESGLRLYETGEGRD